MKVCEIKEYKYIHKQEYKIINEIIINDKSNNKILGDLK